MKSILSALPCCIVSLGWSLSRAWIAGFSSTHSTTLFSGGLTYRPHTSSSFLSNSGSFPFGKSHIRCWCGFRSRLFRI